MANTGFKQATIAYKVNRTDGAALDINGERITVSGRKQAIALLNGNANPNPLLYEVQFYFALSADTTGNPTIEFSQDCVAGLISITPTFLTVDTATPSATFKLNSSGPWALDSGPAGLVALDRSAGPAGTFIITVSRLTTVGQGNFIFKNTATGQTASIYISSVLTRPWVLENGTWNMLGFWYDNGIWNF